MGRPSPGCAPAAADNFEGIAVTHEAGRMIVWVVSDDNHEFFQRTLLLKIRAPFPLTIIIASRPRKKAARCQAAS